jgi:O-antigen/teichoic acid export membrane protein
MLNLIGSGAPMVVAAFCIPVLIRGLGADRFGVLTLSWTVIGYANLFDFGLGRSLTQIVAQRLGAGFDPEIPAVVWTALVLMLLLGIAGSCTMIAATPWLVYRELNIPGLLQKETVLCFYLLALSIPVVITTAGLRGFLEAHQRFALVNVLRLPLGVFMFLGPLLILPFSKSLTLIVVALVAFRALAWLGHLAACFRVSPALFVIPSWNSGLASQLVRLGGWMTVSNIVGPLMVTSDRFIISALLSVAAVTYYSTPFEVVTKLLLIPVAIVGVIFPAFSVRWVQNSSGAAILLAQTIRYMTVAIFPLVLVVIIFANEGLRFWLGADFANHSTKVLQWLALGVFMNSLSHVPFAMVQGAGRPNLTAKLHLVELPIYLITVWAMIRYQGINGAAMAWAGRAILDALCLFIMAAYLLPARTFKVTKVLVALLVLLSCLTVAILPHDIVTKVLFLAVTLWAFALSAWFLVLTPVERARVQGYWARRRAYAASGAREIV